MTQQLFTEWLKKFVLYPRNSRKDNSRILLLVDGHKSRVTQETAELAHKNNIDLMLFPSHTNHILQPLDVSVFKPFKDKYREEPAFEGEERKKEKEKVKEEEEEEEAKLT